MAAVIVEVRTLAGPKHSGQFGGAAPDALIALIHALATLHDANGDVAIPGLRREPWTGASYSDEEFRDLAEFGAGLPFFGTGGLGERVWSGPADRPSPGSTRCRSTAPSTPSSRTRAPRSASASTPGRTRWRRRPRSSRHLEGLRPFGIDLPRRRRPRPARASPRTTAARPTTRRARRSPRAWGAEPVEVASGGSIPLVSALQEAAPDAEILLHRHHRRLRQHPRPERAGPGRRVRAGGAGRGRVLRASTRRDRGGRHERRRSAGGRGRARFNERMLDGIETLGNKVPHPAMIFAGLCVLRDPALGAAQPRSTSR